MINAEWVIRAVLPGGLLTNKKTLLRDAEGFLIKTLLSRRTYLAIINLSTVIVSPDTILTK